MGLKIEHLFFSVSNISLKMDLMLVPILFRHRSSSSLHRPAPTRSRRRELAPTLLSSPSLIRSEGVHGDGARDGAAAQGASGRGGGFIWTDDDSTTSAALPWPLGLRPWPLHLRRSTPTAPPKAR
jgi:hypothetical protein